MSAESGKHIIIVGGGASGVLLACHLLRDDDEAIRVTLIEKRPTIGRGMAYSTAQPGHLLNVRATNMSAFADDPLHFCRWLAENDEDAHGEQPGPLTFAQRRVYGRYIAELVTPHLGLPGEPGRLRMGVLSPPLPRALPSASMTAAASTGTLRSLPRVMMRRRNTVRRVTSIPGRARLIQASIEMRLY